MKNIPLEKLKTDLEESEIDIKNCEIALSEGHKTYGNGESIRKRLINNRYFVNIITKEIERRNSYLISCDGCGIVYDKSKIQFPKDENGEIDKNKACWWSPLETFVPIVKCRVCNEDILDI